MGRWSDSASNEKKTADLSTQLIHGKPNARSTYTLSSRPERSGVERSAVSFLHASLRSAQVGFVCSISQIFFARPQCLICFSRAIVFLIYQKHSNQTSRWHR